MAQRYPPDVQCSFLHGPIDRAEAEQHLIRFADRDGWFLVRRKEGQRDTLVLSVVVAPRVEHHIITLPAYSIGPFQGEHALMCTQAYCSKMCSLLTPFATKSDSAHACIAFVPVASLQSHRQCSPHPSAGCSLHMHLFFTGGDTSRPTLVSLRAYPAHADAKVSLSHLIRTCIVL